MNYDGQHFRLTFSLYLLLLLPFNLFAAASDSEPATMSISSSSSSSSSKCIKKPAKSFDEAWSSLRSGFHRIINQLEGVNDNSSFTSQDYMSYYTIVYELCTDRSGHQNANLLYSHLKKALQDYINSTVLPSLRGKKYELLLRELVRRWSNHKTLTYWISRFFRYLDRYDLPRSGLPSIEETSFLSFHDLVYAEVNQQMVVAVLSMIDQERAGEQIDGSLIDTTLAIFSEIGDSSTKDHAQSFAERLVQDSGALHYDVASSWIASSSFKYNTPKEEKSEEAPIVSSKKIKLESSDGDLFAVDYKVALMSQIIKDLIKAKPAGDIDSIPLSLVSTKVLVKVIEYCKKHDDAEGSGSDDKERSIFYADHLKEWDAEFMEVDQQTLFDLVLASNYLNIKSLLDLSSNKIADMIKGKTPSEIRKMFDIKDDFVPEEEEEHQWAFE